MIRKTLVKSAKNLPYNAVPAVRKFGTALELANLRNGHNTKRYVKKQYNKMDEVFMLTI